MGLFEHWPYVNFHDLNLDWIIKEFPKVYASRDEAQASAEASADSASASQLSADAALESQEAARQSELNAAQSADDAAGSEASAKNYADNIADPVSGLVTGWLNDHVTPTTPIVDDTLTIQGAAADAKVTGDKFTESTNTFNDLKNIIENDIGINVDEFTYWENYMVSATNGTLYSNTNYVCMKQPIAVNPGDIISFENIPTGRTNFVVIYYSAVTDMGGDFVSSDNSTLSTATSAELTVPAGAAYLRFTVGFANATDAADVSPVSVYVNLSTTVKEQLNELTTDVDNITSLYDTVKTPLTGTLLSNKFIESNGSIVDINGYQLLKVSVTPGTKYFVTAQAYSGKYYFIYHDENDELITGGYKSTSPGTTTITDYETTAPQNAAWIYVDSEISANVQAVNIVSGYALPKKWKNLKWCAFGDSLTEVNSKTTIRYYDYVAEKTGISVTNMGAGGTGYINGQASNRAFYQRISNVPTDSDVVTIFGSGNDLSYIAKLGTPTDTGTSTICGCINTTIDNLYAILPTVQLGIVTPTPWETSDPADPNNSMTKYADAIKQICYNRGIPCLDLYHCSNMRPWDATYRTLCYSKDEGGGTHPDETGHKIMSSHFMAFLEELISTY